MAHSNLPTTITNPRSTATHQNKTLTDTDKYRQSQSHSPRLPRLVHFVTCKFTAWTEISVSTPVERIGKRKCVLCGVRCQLCSVSGVQWCVLCVVHSVQCCVVALPQLPNFKKWRHKKIKQTRYFALKCGCKMILTDDYRLPSGRGSTNHIDAELPREY